MPKESFHISNPYTTKMKHLKEVQKHAKIGDKDITYSLCHIQAVTLK